jgi:hypothetical protein
MFAELLEQKLYNVLPIGHTIAAWFLRDNDLVWLHKEYYKMYDIFKDSPALQWMEESGRADERRKAQLLLQQERKKAAQQLRASEKRANKELVVTLRRMVVSIASERFPTLQRLANAQVRLLHQPGLLQEMILRLSLARDIDEAQNALHLVNEDEQGESANAP